MDNAIIIGIEDEAPQNEGAVLATESDACENDVVSISGKEGVEPDTDILVAKESGDGDNVENGIAGDGGKPSCD